MSEQFLNFVVGMGGNQAKATEIYLRGTKPFSLTLLIKLMVVAELVSDGSESKNKK
ncbi:MAG: hypothetical protein ACKVOY_17330 [Burkholderiaceae bacterium]